MSSDAIEPLPESKLGTLEHWDAVYAREVNNFAEIGDKGEIWFGEDAVQRMVDFLEREAEEARLFPHDPTVLDIGTGNGHLLFALLEDVESPLTKPENMLGIDYSPASIELCNKIAGASETEDADKIRFQQLDFLRNADTLKSHRWNIVCDKGTLDAIALSSSTSSSGADTSTKSPVTQYVDSLTSITRKDDVFLITSCNFTEQELRGIFKDSFEVYHVIPVPSFRFGGKQGSTTVSIAFRRL